MQLLPSKCFHGPVLLAVTRAEILSHDQRDAQTALDVVLAGRSSGLPGYAGRDTWPPLEEQVAAESRRGNETGTATEVIAHSPRILSWLQPRRLP